MVRASCVAGADERAFPHLHGRVRRDARVDDLVALGNAMNDLRPRVIDMPTVGFWTVRCVPRGPLCPAAIMRLKTLYEPGEPANAMDRSPFLCAFISGQPVALGDVWHRRGRVIHRAEYDRAVAEIAEAVRANVYDPRTNPWKPVDIQSLPLPFAERA
jgi:hypothetical protein